MGVVYRAFDPAIHRPVAIKTIIKSAMDPSELQYALTRFRHEAQAVGRLTHPRIVQIYDYGEEMDLAYIVMEMVNGKSLFEHLQGSAHFGLKEIGEIIRQLLDGLDYAHGQGVIHRDVKPSNILVNDDGRIKISDFGIARLDSSTLTQVGEIMGSPGYMSPEQFIGSEIDARSDIYSAAVIAYELLAGRKPFTGSGLEIMRQAVNERPVNPSEHNPLISVQLDWATQKALAKKPAERFQTAREFSDAIAKGIEASLRVSARAAGAPVLDEPTLRIDRNLAQAARMLAGIPAPRMPAVDAPTEPAMAGRPSPAKAPATVPGGAVDTSKLPRVLFVDDEERILTALRSIFRTHYQVFTATSGAEALEIVKKVSPHVIVSDQRMPGMTGVELLRQTKEVLPKSVRMLLTGYSDLAAIVGSINEGEVFRFVSKPWDNAEIQKTIAEAAAIGVELADAATTPPILPDPVTSALLVVDRDQQLFRAAKELLGSSGPIHHAQSLDEAFAALDSRETAVILADIENAGSEVIATFKLLKQQHPAILTIVVTAASDSELVIELINQAQVFRFLTKPVNLKLLKQNAQAAFVKYQSFKQTPQLVLQHQVASPAGQEAKTTGTVLGRVKSLRNWFRPGANES
jgi:serine/threonine-protein kinase